MSSPPLHTSFKQLFNTQNAETMNKRSCPFDEDLCPQLKVHVGPKEAADGNSKEELKKIYGKKRLWLIIIIVKNLLYNMYI